MTPQPLDRHSNYVQEGSVEFGIDPEIIAAVAYCGVGHRRLTKDEAFNEAKRIGLLAQDPVWRPTERGMGVLVAAGWVKGEPAPRRTSLCVMWAVSERYPTPQYVGAWPEWTWEHMDRQDVEAVQEDFRDHCDDEGWRFFERFEHIDQPKVPEVVDAD